MMLQLLPLLIITEAFCLYHAYTNKAEQKWFYLILFLPFIGCGIYLYHHFYSRKNLETISEGVKAVINTNYQVENLEKGVEFADTIENKSMLADKYVEMKRYDDAITLYESCLEGFNHDNPEIISRLVKVNQIQGNYENSVFYAEKIENNIDFMNSEEKSYYAWSLFELGRSETAEEKFKEMDRTFSNYFQRLQYSRFLHKSGRREESLDKLTQLINEFDQMGSQEKRFHRDVQQAIRGLQSEVSREKI